LSGIVIFTDDPGWHGEQLRASFARLGFSAQYVSLTQCRFQIQAGFPAIQIPGFSNSLPEAVFVRGVPGGSLQEVVFYLDILHALKMSGVPVYNDGRAIERSVDKAMTSFLLQQAGLPTPKTWVLRERDEALCVAEEELKAGRFLISKPLFGSQGEGIRRIEKMTDLFWLTASQGIYYLQQFIVSPEDDYSDIRVFVINGKAFAAMRRRGQSWLNNVAKGAACEALVLTKTLSGLAEQATAVLSMDYAGVDIIEDEDGQFSIIEVNSIPAWKGLQKVCGVNIADLLITDLQSRYLAKESLIYS
jgi:RimK family alpha-L-glutamate ligase